MVNRTDRLYAIGEELRRSGDGGVTAAELAQRFETSVRTIKRDIAALQQTGMPIWAQTGPGGGYFLSGTTSLPPINFTPTQAAAVALALAALPEGSPFAADIRAASAKILDALPQAGRARAEALAERLWVMPAGQVGNQVIPDPPIRHAVECALTDHRALSITYRSADGTSTTRTVEAIILAASGDWYLVAYCRLRQAIRWFRVDRIERAHLTRQTYQPRPVSDIGTPPPTARPSIA